jgi:hypothetical protein
MLDIFRTMHVDPKLFALIAFAVLVVFELLRALLKKLGFKVPESAITWQSYVRGQGLLLLVCLLLGGAVGWGSVFLGQRHSSASDSGRLLEFRQLKVDEQPVYEDVDTGGYRKADIYAKALNPSGAKVDVHVLTDMGDQSEQSIHLLANDGSWSHVTLALSTKRLGLMIGEAKQGDTKASQADVLVFLSTR